MATTEKLPAIHSASIANVGVADIEMVDNSFMRQWCPKVEYQAEIPSAVHSQQQSQRESQVSQSSKRSGKGKDLHTLVTVLRSKYPHPVNYLTLESAEERASRENLDNIRAVQPDIQEEAPPEDIDELPAPELIEEGRPDFLQVPHQSPQ